MTRNRTPRNTTFNNNIFYCAGSGSMGANANNGSNVIYDTNVYFNVTPPGSETNGLTSDPLFVSPGAEPFDIDMVNDKDLLLGGYKLSPGSPHVDGGLTIADNGGLDFWGSPVPSGPTDLGASENADDFDPPTPDPMTWQLR